MDQQIYETYEFLDAEGEGHSESQFLVVQNDGTFLTVNRPIQYIAQGEDVKTVLEQVEPTEFDGNQQEFFVHGSEELITDQFVVSNGDNNVYTNGFLLKSIENVKDEANENEISEFEVSNIDDKPPEEVNLENQEIQNTYEEVPVEFANADEKAQSDCTEITLSDEQYQILQEKGWILLETNDKKYLLDSYGLHDITNNDDLIEKLQGEQNTVLENQSTVPDVKDFITENQEIQSPVDTTKQDTQETQEIISFSTDTPKLIKKRKIVDSNVNTEVTPEPSNVKTETPPEPLPRSHNPIKIKTKYLFKDIPSRVVLGKAANGKNLIARVVKTNRPMADSTDNTNNHPSGPNYTGLSEIRFESLIRQKLNETEERCNAKDISAAEVVVGQLLSVPSFRAVVVGRQLVVTKSILMETAIGSTYWENRCSLVTGKVSSEGAEPRFIYVPKLLHKLLTDGEAILFFRRSKDINEGSFLHIHVSEMKAADGIVRMSITLNKRHLPLKLVKEQIKIRQNTMFACSSCAVVFQTEEELQHHQETECMEVDDTLTIVTENQKSAYTVVDVGKEKQYVCNQCQMSFTKLNNCQKHVKTHFNNEIENHDGNTEVPKKKHVFKCKMCPSTYFHPSTLSKHIVSKHIKTGVSMLNQPKMLKTHIKLKSSQIQNSAEEKSDEKQKVGKVVYYKCKMCPSTYVHPATLTKHILSEHVKSI